MSFEELNLIPPIISALDSEGYINPTPIQEKAIPIILDKKDILGCAQTGTGKTAAFAIPVIQLLSQKVNTEKGRKKVKVLVLTPTRELAIQIGESFEAYGKFTHLSTTVIFGGVGQKQQTDALQMGTDIVVATPGRLLDLMGQGFINLQSLEIFVLDEADRMLDMGFIHDVKKVIAKLPAKRQTLFFSATMPPAIQQLAGSILNNPEKIAVTPVSSTVEIIQQSVYFVNKSDKPSLLVHVLNDASIITALVFTRTKHGADKIARLLNHKGIKSEAIHGNKSQNARQRALNNFKSKETRVLVASDIAARGIDIDDLSCVVNFDIPNVPETYVHRIGRTGRAGSEGSAISFCDTEEKKYLHAIHKLIAKSIPVVNNHPFPMNEVVTGVQQSDLKYNNIKQPKLYKKPNFRSKNWSKKTKRSF